MPIFTNPPVLDETGKKIVDELEAIKNALTSGKDNMIYGIKRSLTSSSTAWERINQSVGMQANATHDGSAVNNDFDNIYPWSDIITVNYDVENAKIKSYYGDVDFKFDGSNGEVMTLIPRHYQKRWKDASYEYIQVARLPFDGAQLVEEFLVGRYTTSSGVHSKSGVSSTVSQTRATFRSQAKAKGDKWQQLDWHIFFIQNLYLVEYADANSQSVLGGGNSSTSAQITLGGCDTLGMKSGCLANDNAHAVIYRGMENIFGNIWQFIDGINIKDNVAYICEDPESFADDVFTGAYTALGYTNASANGNPSAMGYDANNPLMALPVSVGTSLYGDYYWQNSGNRIVLFGGVWLNGAHDGLFCFDCSYDSSKSYVYIGSRLLKISV